MRKSISSSQLISPGVIRRHTIMAPSNTESDQNAPFNEATSPTQQQHVTAAARRSSSQTSTSFRKPMSQPLIKTIFVFLMVFIVFVDLIVPVAALDNRISPMTPQAQNTHDASITTTSPRFSIGMLWGPLCAMGIGISASISTMMGKMLCPLMGATGVLWFVLRNSEGIPPVFVWM